MKIPTWLSRGVLLSVLSLATHAGGAAEATATTAEARAFTFNRGVNISHWLSQNSGERTYAAPWFDEEDVEWISQQGFDHVRLPVDVRVCLAADGSLDADKLTPIFRTIGWAKARHLGVVLDVHFLPGADFNPVGGDKRVYTDPALQDRVAAVWRELAAKFRDEGPWLRFEILNEPVASENRQLNPFMHRMLAAIRETNPDRIVYVTSNQWSQFKTVPDVELPDDAHVALTIHNYEPLVFTHQRASWAGFKDTMPAVTFPGEVPSLEGHMLDGFDHGLVAGEPLTVAQIEKAFAGVEAWVKRTRPNLEVYVGEFGVYRSADADSQRRWIATLVKATEERGWSWAVWDYQGGFAVRNPDGSGTPILEGLFARKP